MSMLNPPPQRSSPRRVLANWQLLPSSQLTSNNEGPSTGCDEAVVEHAQCLRHLREKTLEKDGDGPRCVMTESPLSDINQDRHRNSHTAPPPDLFNTQLLEGHQVSRCRHPPALKSIDANALCLNLGLLTPEQVPAEDGKGGIGVVKGDRDSKSRTAPDALASTRSQRSDEAPGGFFSRFFSLTEVGLEGGVRGDYGHAKAPVKAGGRASFVDDVQPSGALMQAEKGIHEKFVHGVNGRFPSRSFVSSEFACLGSLLSFSSVHYIEITSLSEEIQEQLNQEQQSRRQKIKRVFKPRAPSIFSVTLPHVREDGSIVVDRDGYAKTKPLNRESVDADEPRPGSKSDVSGYSYSQKCLSQEEEGAATPRLPCGGLTVNQVLKRLIDRESPSKRTLFTGLEVQRLMRGVPQASEFVVVLFWYVVFRGRRTWIEELLIGRCERLFVTFQELLPDAISQPQWTLPPYEHLEVLVKELEHMIRLRDAWVRMKEMGSSVHSSSEASAPQSTRASTSHELLYDFMYHRYVCINKYLPNIINSKLWPKEEDIQHLSDALDLLAISREEYLGLISLEERTYRRLAYLFSEIFHTIGAQPAGKPPSSGPRTSPSPSTPTPARRGSSETPSLAPLPPLPAGRPAYAENNVVRFEMKDIVIQTYLSLAARIVYYALVYCFPNDVATGEMLDRRFRADLLRTLLFWSSGVVLGHPPTAGWPVPSEADLAHDAEDGEAREAEMGAGDKGARAKAASKTAATTPSASATTTTASSPRRKGGWGGSAAGARRRGSFLPLKLTHTLRPYLSDLLSTSEAAQPQTKKDEKAGGNLGEPRRASLIRDSSKEGDESGLLSPPKEARTDRTPKIGLPRLIHRHSSKANLHSKRSFVRNGLDPPKDCLKGKYSAKKTQLLGIGNGNTFNNADVSIANVEHRLMAEFNHYQRHARRLFVELQKHTARQGRVYFQTEQRRQRRLEKGTRDDDAGSSRGLFWTALKSPLMAKRAKQPATNVSSACTSSSYSREEAADLDGVRSYLPSRRIPDSQRSSLTEAPRVYPGFGDWPRGPRQARLANKPATPLSSLEGGGGGGGPPPRPPPRARSTSSASAASLSAPVEAPSPPLALAPMLSEGIPLLSSSGPSSRGGRPSYLLATFPLAACAAEAREYLCVRGGVRYPAVPIPAAGPAAARASQLLALQRRPREGGGERGGGSGGRGGRSGSGSGGGPRGSFAAWRTAAGGDGCPLGPAPSEASNASLAGEIRALAVPPSGAAAGRHRPHALLAVSPFIVEYASGVRARAAGEDAADPRAAPFPCSPLGPAEAGTRGQETPKAGKVGEAPGGGAKPKPLLPPISPYRMPSMPCLPANISRAAEEAVGRLKHRVIPKLHALEDGDDNTRPLRFVNLQKEALARERMLIKKVERIANRSKLSQQIYMKNHLTAMGNVQSAKSHETANQLQRKLKAALNAL